MGTRYESAARNRGLYGTGFRVKFNPDATTKSTDNPEGFGAIDSDNPNLITHANLKGSDGKPLGKKDVIIAIEALIESEPEFLANVKLHAENRFGAGGKFIGIWKKEWRVASQGKTTIGSFRTQLSSLGADALRAIIAENKHPAPAKDASIDKLVDAALMSMGGPAAVIQAPAGTDVDPDAGKTGTGKK